MPEAVEARGVTIIPSVSPMELTVIESEQTPVFDTSVPMDMQLQLTGLHRRTIDGYGKIIGSSNTEQALVLSAYIPQQFYKAVLSSIDNG